MDDIVVAVHVDDNIVGIGGPGFVVVDVAYARDVVVLVHVLWNVSVVDDIVVAVHVDDNIVGIGGPGFVVVVDVAYARDAVVLVHVLWNVQLWMIL